MNEILEKIATSGKALELIKDELPDVHAISTEFYINGNAQKDFLINNTDDEYNVKARRSEFRYRFEQPLYVKSLTLEAQGYSSFHSADFSWITASGREIKVSSVKIIDGSFSVDVLERIDGFSFKPDRGWKAELKSIYAEGYSSKEFDLLLDRTLEIEKHRASISGEVAKAEDRVSDCADEVASMEAQKNSISDEIEGLEGERNDVSDQCSRVNQELKQLKENASELKSNIQSLENKEQNIEYRLQVLDEEIANRKLTKNDLSEDLAGKEKQLKSLKNDINIFPTEMAGFVKQGAKNVKLYSLLALVPITILVFMVVALFYNAADLTTLYKTEEDVSVWTILLTRLPFVLIAVTIIHASYRLASKLISDIIQINTQRLNLAKVALIAKDVSDVASVDLGFDDDTTHYYRTQLKMELLKEHLKQYIGEDYHFQIKSREQQTHNLTSQQSESEIVENDFSDVEDAGNGE